METNQPSGDGNPVAAAQEENLSGKPAPENRRIDNPFGGAPGKTKMVRLRVLKLAIYEGDGKHVKGDEIEATEARARELIETGYCEPVGEVREVAPGDVHKEFAKSDAPRA